MKKKEIRWKYISKKKSLTIAVTALILSGSPLGAISASAVEENARGGTAQLDKDSPKEGRTVLKDAAYYTAYLESFFVSPTTSEIVEGVDYNTYLDLHRMYLTNDMWLNFYDEYHKWRPRIYLLQALVAQKGIKIVNLLFDDKENTNLKSSITQQQITYAVNYLKIMPDLIQHSDYHTGNTNYEIRPMKIFLVTAQRLYNERVRTQVDGLFTDETQSALAGGVDQATIDEISVIVAELPDGETKKDLLNQIDIAQQLLTGNPKLEAAQSSVESLFMDDNHKLLADGVTQVTIDEAKGLVDLLPETAAKTALISLIETAQELLTAASNLKKAKTAVHQLFIDKTHATLADGVTQAIIDAAQTLVNQLPEGQVKEELDALIKVAQTLLDKELAIVEITEFDTYMEGDSIFISGEFTGKNVKYMRSVVNGEKKLLITSATLANGVFTYYLPGLLSTDKVEFVLFDHHYKEVSRKEITITASPTQITDFDKYEEGISSFIQGTFAGGEVKYMRPVVNGENKLLITSATLSKGIFSYYSPGLKVTDKVEFILFDTNYKQVARKVVPITVSSTHITKFEAYEAGKSTFLSGEFSGTNVKYMRPVVNGENKVLITSTTLAKGTFSYYFPGLKVTDKVEFVLFDENYKEVTRKSVMITASPDAVEIDEFDAYLEGTSVFIKGSYSGTNAKYMRPVINGESKALIGSVALAEGMFSYYFPGLKVTDKVEFVLFDLSYKEIGRKLLVVTKA